MIGSKGIFQDAQHVGTVGGAADRPRASAGRQRASPPMFGLAVAVPPAVSAPLVLTLVSVRV